MRSNDAAKVAYSMYWTLYVQDAKQRWIKAEEGFTKLPRIRPNNPNYVQFDNITADVATQWLKRAMTRPEYTGEEWLARKIKRAEAKILGSNRPMSVSDVPGAMR